MTQRLIRVFIASPGDLAVERKIFKQALDDLNGGFGDGLNIKFVALGWEDTLASTGRRSQAVINLEIDQCDVFILAMHRRWGQPAPDAHPYSSYTEEEFHRALTRWQKKQRGKHQSPEIFVFFKHIDSLSMADPGPQLQKVLDFRRSLEESRQVLYHGFTGESDFKREVDRHLRAYAKGELPKANAPLDKVLLPLAALTELEKERAEKEQALKLAEREHQVAEAAAARAEAFALEFAERASRAALEGRVEEARQDFAKATVGTTNLRLLFLAYEFYHRIGELGTAEELVKRRIAICGWNSKSTDAARALGNLGLICQTRGDLDRAEELHKKALAIDKELSNHEGVARHCSNLGVIYEGRGKLAMAEKMQSRSLAIEERLGRLEGIASSYCNLGLIYDTRGELERAEEMHTKALAIENKIGNELGMAIQYGNLGLIYQKQGKLQKARQMHVKAFAINEKLVNREGMASDYDNFASLAAAQGEFDRARELWTKARDLYSQIGMPNDVTDMQKLLDEAPAIQKQKLRSAKKVVEKKQSSKKHPKIAK